ncbi:MAG: hypothetical protein ABI425_03670 [Patescibacteria group bacterium]
MNTTYKTVIATGISLVALFLSATTAFADGASATPTPTPVTREECTTGAYGQQTCKNVPVEKVHPPIAAGLGDNIVFAVAALFVLSAAGYTYSKVNA